MTSTCCLGVDGGATSTLAVIADGRGRVWGVGEAGPANADVVGPEAAVANILQAVRGAQAEAAGAADGGGGEVAGGGAMGGRADASPPAGAPPLAGACLARAGLDMPPDDLAWRRHEVAWRARLPGEPAVRVVNDGVAAVHGAFAGAPGIVVIAGTGSVAHALNVHGQTVRVGGWGRVLGDQGSAWDVGRRGLRAAIRSAEGWGPATALEARALRTYEIAVLHDLLRRKMTPAADLFAPQVLAAAAGGDPVARHIRRDAADALADMAAMLHERDASGGRVALVGGMFRDRHYRSAVRRRIELRCHGAKVTAVQEPPVLGALRLAFAAARLPIPERFQVGGADLARMKQ